MRTRCRSIVPVAKAKMYTDRLDIALYLLLTTETMLKEFRMAFQHWKYSVDKHQVFSV